MSRMDEEARKVIYNSIQGFVDRYPNVAKSAVVAVYGDELVDAALAKRYVRKRVALDKRGMKYHQLYR